MIAEAYTVLIFEDDSQKTVYLVNAMHGPLMIGHNHGKELKLLFQIGDLGYVEYNEQPQKKLKTKPKPKKKTKKKKVRR